MEAVDAVCVCAGCLVLFDLLFAHCEDGACGGELRGGAAFFGHCCFSVYRSPTAARELLVLLTYGDSRRRRAFIFREGIREFAAQYICAYVKRCNSHEGYSVLHGLIKSNLGISVLAVSTLLLSGCASSSENHLEPEETALAEPGSIVEDCGPEIPYETLDSGNAVELNMLSLLLSGETGPFDCVMDRIGVSEASFETGQIGDKLEGDGYTMTVINSDGKMIIERH